MAETLYRRTLQIVLFILTLFFILGFPISRVVQAQATVSVDIISNAKVNSTVDIAVRVTNSSGVAGFQFDLEYDPQVVVVTGVTAGSLLPAGTFLENLNDAASGSIRVVWFKNQGSPDINNNGELCRITFRVLSLGRTDLELKGPGKDQKPELVDQGGGKINVNTPQKGSIITDGYTSSGGSSSGSVSISTASFLPYAYKGTYYNCSLTAAGGTGSYTWEKVSGSLPTGLSMDSHGIYGTPKSIGRHDFKLKASNVDGWAEKSFTLWVIEEGSQVPYLYADSGSLYSYSDRVAFRNLKITQGSMELNLSPENMPYTMVVDGSINWVNLLVSLNASGDTLYINNARHIPSEVKSIPLAKGTNEIAFYVKSSGKTSVKYFLTIYKMPGRR